MRVVTVDAPRDYAALVAPVPHDVRITKSAGTEPAFVHVFATSRAKLASHLKALRKSIAQDGAVWVSWPKKSAKVDTDVTEDTIRSIALPQGWVDVKVCAVSDVWSGLKLVIRKSER